jgi:hypothetical protein
MCAMTLITFDALFSVPSYFWPLLPCSVFVGLRMIGSPVAHVLSAVSGAFVMSIPFRCAVVRWLSLLAPFWGLASLSFCSPLLRAMAKLLAAVGCFQASAVPLTIGPGVVLPCDSSGTLSSVPLAVQRLR